LDNYLTARLVVVVRIPMVADSFVCQFETSFPQRRREKIFFKALEMNEPDQFGTYKQ
jgi:hypothetical protein